MVNEPAMLKLKVLIGYLTKENSNILGGCKQMGKVSRK